MDRQRMPRLSLDLLRGFRAAARHLSFTHAARELFITQSAISHQVRTLEEQLGQPLFRRVNRSLQLTQPGAELFRAVDEALDADRRRCAAPRRSLAHALGHHDGRARIDLAGAAPAALRAGRIRRSTCGSWPATTPSTSSASTSTSPSASRPCRCRRRRRTRSSTTCSSRSARPRWRGAGASRCARAADLARHVLIDFETVLYGRVWYDWEQWSKLRCT